MQYTIVNGGVFEVDVLHQYREAEHIRQKGNDNKCHVVFREEQNHPPGYLNSIFRLSGPSNDCAMDPRSEIMRVVNKETGCDDRLSSAIMENIIQYNWTHLIPVLRLGVWTLRAGGTTQRQLTILGGEDSKSRDRIYGLIRVLSFSLGNFDLA